jgi:hypothetical protein
MTEPLRVLFALEDDRQLHHARLLVLLKAFAGRKNSGHVAGLTKLAKLDFLLRYPTYLERALQQRQANSEKVKVRVEERLSVESRMIRYRYGPWDDRYRQLLNELVGLRLVHVTVRGRTIDIGLTDAGFTQSESVASSPAFEDIDRRSRLLKSHFDLSATRLMNFIYDTFPEIADMRLREEIRP